MRVISCLMPLRERAAADSAFLPMRGFLRGTGGLDEGREGLVAVADGIEEERPLVVVVGEELLDRAVDPGERTFRQKDRVGEKRLLQTLFAIRQKELMPSRVCSRSHSLDNGFQRVDRDIKRVDCYLVRW